MIDNRVRSTRDNFEIIVTNVTPAIGALRKRLRVNTLFAPFAVNLYASPLLLLLLLLLLQ